MAFHPRIDTPPLTRNGRRARFFPVLPWIFIIGVAVGTIVGNRYWRPWIKLPPVPITRQTENSGTETLWRHAGNPDIRHAVTVVRTIDGDTFEARVPLWPGLTITTHVRLRGIDAPELKARCANEFRRAEAAADALDRLLGEGNVTIYNIGPDKYPERVDAEVATSRTPNVSAALLAGGYARPYDGGHRDGWCAGR